MAKRILIVDDNVPFVSFLGKQLAAAGHEVVTAATGLTAVGKLADYDPEVIFIDYFLPHLTGDKLCRIIRQMKHLENAYLVIMSAAASELQLDLRNTGANALIAKGTFKETARHVFTAIAAAENVPGTEPGQEIMGLDGVYPRQMTIELLGANRHLQTILDCMAEGIVEIHHGRIIYANPAAAAILGRTQEQLLTVRFLSFFEEPALSRVAGLVEGDSGDALVVDGPGVLLQARTLSMKKLLFRGEDESRIILIDDITEQDLAEKALHEYQEHLETLVQERTADLNRAHRILQQVEKMEAIGTLAGGIAHDFNNILGAIIGFTELIKMAPDPEKSPYYLDQILQSCDRAREMVSQILTFSHRQNQERKPVFLGPLIEEGIKLIRSSIPSTIEIQTSITRTPAKVCANATQVHQVLMNLSANAAHAMRDRGGILGVRLVRERIDPDRAPCPAGLSGGDYAVLTLSDTGHGIDTAIRDKIFDPFFTTKDPGEGTGLGLSVVYGIIKAHRGVIDVASEPGKGTAISVYFPIDGSPDAEQEPIAAVAPRGNERVLVVDDEAMLVEVLAGMLTSLGYRVTAMTSSVEALKVFEDRPRDFDVAITDMTMPNLRGDELACALMKIRPELPVILCTGFSDMISAEQARSAGIRKFIMKPLSMNELARTIREVF